MKQTKRQLLITALALLVTISYAYTQLVCDTLVSFETVVRDTFGVNYDNAGDLIFTESSVDVYIDSMLWASGSKGYFWAYIDTPACEFSYGNTVWFNNVALIFDISGISTNGVSFKYYDMGGEENLQVNGDVVHVIPDFKSLPPDVAPGVACMVDSMGAEGCEGGVVGRVNLIGPVNTLLIAGQELWIDSVCIDDVITFIPDNFYRPAEYLLGQNYPNPFSLATEISYSLMKPGIVSLKVYDIYGRETRELVNEHHSAGNYYVTFNAGNLPGGVYYYRLKINDVIKTRRMLLLQ